MQDDRAVIGEQHLHGFTVFRPENANCKGTKSQKPSRYQRLHNVRQNYRFVGYVQATASLQPHHIYTSDTSSGAHHSVRWTRVSGSKTTNIPGTPEPLRRILVYT
jgi:hypothetical protein